MNNNHFADELISRVRSLGHPLCVGLDPYLDRIPPPFRRGSMTIGDPRSADAVADFLGAVIDRLSGKVAVVKPQIALFEQLGWRGMKMLEGILDRARKQRLLVLLDAKRGDIGATAEGYAQAYLDPSSSMSVDAMTVNPYMGRDAIEPFVRRAEQERRGVFVLVRNSNPGSSDYQCLETGKGLLFEVVADSLREIE